jgi:alpha-glucosidase
MVLDATPSRWWSDGVLYQIYPRSFMDSDGDGIGDLQGVIERLDYLAWLGIDGIWLNPTMPSPNADWGYDVADYRAVHSDLGTQRDLDALVAEAGRRNIRVLLDLVPNHTSNRHPWFVDALTGRDSEHRDYYVWADPKPDGSPPNNWQSVFGGEPAWELDPASGQYYLHNFLREQPDLNWWNERVRAEFDDILRYWFDRGIAGFRIDVAHSIIKDSELRDNPAASASDDVHARRVGQVAEFNMNRPEVHEVLRRWRAIADGYEPSRILVGETYVLEVERLVTYYGSGSDELHLAFNFPFAHVPFDGESLRAIVETTESLLPRGAWPVWTGSNHDVGRFATRWCDGDERKCRLALMLLLTLRGTPFLYYGDEIAMAETPFSLEEMRDPIGRRFWPDANAGRDGCRTPMQWSAEQGAGFTDPGAVPWIKLGDHKGHNVEQQRDDPNSVLNLTRALIALRRSSKELTTGDYSSLESPPGVWSFTRGGRFTVALNMSEPAQALNGVEGRVVISTDLTQESERVSSPLTLDPWQGLIIEAP